MRRFAALALAAALLLVAQPAAAEPWLLDTAIDHALAHNPDIAENAAAVEIADRARQEVFGNFLPQLTGTAGYQYQGNVPEMVISITPDIPIPNIPPFTIDKTVEMGDHDNYLAQLELKQLLFASGRVYYGHRAAARQVESAELRIQVVRLRVAQKTAEAFYGVLIAQEVFAAQTQSFERATAHLEQVRHRKEAGAASRFELLRAQVEVDNIEPEVTKARQLVGRAKEGFRRALGLPPEASVEVSGSFATEKSDVNVTAVRELALEHRPEPAAYAVGAAAYEDRAKSRLAEMLPSVALTGTYGYQKPFFYDPDGDTQWTVGVGLSVPLFDGLKAWRGRGGSLAQAEQLRLSAQRVRADIDLELSDAVLGMREAGQRIGSTEANVKRAETMVDIAEKSYAAGALTSLEVIDAQLAATGARLAHLQAQYDYRVAKVRLAAATGDLASIRR
jgi:outer membrane protein TolC